MEKPPIISDLYNDNSFHIILDMEQNDVLKKIQDDYLYWNKVKYKTDHKNKENVWSAVKLHRKMNSKSLFFASYKFTYPTTDFIQRTLHQFDLHFGGTLGSNIGISETDKTKFMISSIMEEAISSSQMEGANTTRKKAKEMIQQEKNREPNLSK